MTARIAAHNIHQAAFRALSRAGAGVISSGQTSGVTAVGNSPETPVSTQSTR